MYSRNIGTRQVHMWCGWDVTEKTKALVSESCVIKPLDQQLKEKPPTLEETNANKSIETWNSIIMNIVKHHRSDWRGWANWIIDSGWHNDWHWQRRFGIRQFDLVSYGEQIIIVMNLCRPSTSVCRINLLNKLALLHLQWMKWQSGQMRCVFVSLIWEIFIIHYWREKKCGYVFHYYFIFISSNKIRKYVINTSPAHAHSVQYLCIQLTSCNRFKMKTRTL